MAGFADLVASGVAIANTITSTLQANVEHYAYSDASTDAYGKLTWGPAFSRPALIEDIQQRASRDVSGDLGKTPETLVAPRTRVTFLSPIKVDPKDRIVLPTDAEGNAGDEGPILSVEGLINPTTGQHYLTEVIMGKRA